MYVPAHRGLAPNAVADAVAKAAMKEATGWHIRRQMANRQHGRAVRNDCLGPPDDNPNSGGGQRELERVGTVMAARAGDAWPRHSTSCAANVTPSGRRKNNPPSTS